ncbi:MAG: hypothetical protein ABH879_10670 [archaeon]
MAMITFQADSIDHAMGRVREKRIILQDFSTASQMEVIRRPDSALSGRTIRDSIWNHPYKLTVQKTGSGDNCSYLAGTLAEPFTWDMDNLIFEIYSDDFEGRLRIILFESDGDQWTLEKDIQLRPGEQAVVRSNAGDYDYMKPGNEIDSIKRIERFALTPIPANAGSNHTLHLKKIYAAVNTEQLPCLYMDEYAWYGNDSRDTPDSYLAGPETKILFLGDSFLHIRGRVLPPGK